jgi:hypothetical protein
LTQVPLRRSLYSRAVGIISIFWRRGFMLTSSEVMDLWQIPSLRAAATRFLTKGVSNEAFWGHSKFAVRLAAGLGLSL